MPLNYDNLNFVDFIFINNKYLTKQMILIQRIKITELNRDFE